MEALKIEWSAVLPIGEEKAISGEELARRCGFSDCRALRYAVADARLQGVGILSTANGYFMADIRKPEEIAHTVNILKKRAYTSLKQAAVLDKWLGDQEGREPALVQMSINDFLKEVEKG